VSLVQPYDGGGFPIPDPAQWTARAVNSAAAVDTTVILTMEATEIGRILAVSCNLNAGVAPSVSIQILDQQGFATCISNRILIPVISERNGFQIFSPIIAPGHVLQGRHFGGDAATVVEWLAYVVRVPRGTVFYV